MSKVRLLRAFCPLLQAEPYVNLGDGNLVETTQVTDDIPSGQVEQLGPFVTT